MQGSHKYIKCNNNIQYLGLLSEKAYMPLKSVHCLDTDQE